MRRVAWILGGVVILGGATAIAMNVTQPPPPELEAVETFPDLGVEHLFEGDDVPEYNSDPPTSGPHAQAPAPCGIYRQPVPDVAVLHSMEHGAIVIHYDPRLDDGRRQQLEEIARSLGSETILAPRPEPPSPVVLTAWTKRLLLDDVDQSTIEVFRAEFANRSPEGAAVCPVQVDEGQGG